MSQQVTIVNYYGSQDDSRCGYCANSSSSQSHGMWAHRMTADDYQGLIDRGWRRSGQYCYKPNNEITCCPSYTIKCDAREFKFSKSHKKVLKKMNSFLKTGQKVGSGNNVDVDADIQSNVDCDTPVEEQPMESGESSALTECKMITSNQPKPIDIDNVLEIIAKTENGIEPETGSKVETETNITAVSSLKKSASNDSKKREAVNGPDPTKPLQPKAKILRQQRKAEKAANAISSNETAPAIVPKPSKNQEKSLKTFIEEMPKDGQHKLKVKLVLSTAASSEVILELYRRYQIAIHKDPPEKLTRKCFENFLVRSPLQLILVNVESDAFERSKNDTYIMYSKYQIRVHNDPPSDISEFVDFLCKSPIKHETPESGPSSGYGSFHQQYWLDEKLIAVGVNDILPKCVSSVYFFYDPDYSVLTLGTYGTLRELEFVQELNKTNDRLCEYYMGFYIHSCPKMRYKAKLNPSLLLCPEVYSWHLITDDTLKKLDESKYSRLNPDPLAQDLNKFSPSADLNHLRLLVDYKYCLTYKNYQEYKGTNGTDSDEEDCDNFTEYGQLVGKVLSRRICLVK